MEKMSQRDAFFNRLYDIAKEDRNVILVSADMGAPALDKYRKDLASQYVNVGIAEQSMITLAAGLALSGKKVYTYAIMPFATLRAYEITRVDLSMMNLPITIVGVGAGFSYDDSGPTHHSTEDITVMRVLPHMTLLNASDAVMASAFADISYKTPGPSYVRLDREVLPSLYKAKTDFFDGFATQKIGKDLTIIATGNMVHQALKIAKELAKSGLDAGVVDYYRIKPVNGKSLLKIAAGAKKIVTLEEQFLAGGMGTAVAEVLIDAGKNIPIKRFGIGDNYYYVYGGRDNIHRVIGLDVKTVTKGILDWMKQK